MLPQRTTVKSSNIHTMHATNNKDDGCYKPLQAAVMCMLLLRREKHRALELAS
jgi:hypothetical protein